HTGTDRRVTDHTGNNTTGYQRRLLIINRTNCGAGTFVTSQIRSADRASEALRGFTREAACAKAPVACIVSADLRHLPCTFVIQGDRITRASCTTHASSTLATDKRSRRCRSINNQRIQSSASSAL